MMQVRMLLLMLMPILVAPILVPNVFAAPGELCQEQISVDPCGLLSNPLSFATQPFDELMPGFGGLLIWGPVIFAIWMVSKSPMITAVVGLIVATSVIGLDQDAVGVGVLLMALSIGIAMFQLFPRIKRPLT